jgi:hypothetical protein
LVFPEDDLIDKITRIVGKLTEDDLSFINQKYIRDAITELDDRNGRINYLREESWIPDKFRPIISRMLEFNPYFRLSPYQII